MTFTVGKHKMRNKEEATIEEVAPSGRLIGHYGRDIIMWEPDGRWCHANGHDHPYDLLPPSPPKLEPIVDWVVRDKDGKIWMRCKSENCARLQAKIHEAQIGEHAPYTIHKRATEQVED